MRGENAFKVISDSDDCEQWKDLNLLFEEEDLKILKNNSNRIVSKIKYFCSIFYAYVSFSVSLYGKLILLII